jgi:PAS domain S-box-containing protein
VAEAQRQEALCQIQLAEMRGEIRLLQATVRRLQEGVGDEAPAVTAAAMITADLAKGIIRQVSPGIGPLLHWTQKDLLGKPVSTLLPESLRAAHDEAFTKLAASGQLPWSERTILTKALRGDGGELPVAINLTGWKTPNGDWMISAEIKRRRHTKLSVASADNLPGETS